MTRRATTQAIAATERTEGDSDAVRIRHQLDAWANASNRTPRLVATPAEDVSVEPSGEAPLPATKRSRAPSASARTKAAKGTKAKSAKAKADEAKERKPQQGRWRAGGARRAAGTAAGFRSTRRAGGRCRHAGTRPHQPRLCPCRGARAGDGRCLFFGRGHGRDISRRSGRGDGARRHHGSRQAGDRGMAGRALAADQLENAHGHGGAGRRPRADQRRRRVRQAGRGACQRGGHVAFRRHRAHRSARRPGQGAIGCRCRPRRPHCADRPGRG